jgi:hypothetical protein
MIKYQNAKTTYTTDEKEINQAISLLIIFCGINSHSEQAKKLKKHLEEIETAIHKGDFKE